MVLSLFERRKHLFLTIYRLCVCREKSMLTKELKKVNFKPVFRIGYTPNAFCVWPSAFTSSTFLAAIKLYSIFSRIICCFLRLKTFMVFSCAFYTSTSFMWRNNNFEKKESRNKKDWKIHKQNEAIIFNNNKSERSEQTHTTYNIPCRSLLK